MDINAEACIKQGEELGMIAKKKSALKYQMQSFANNLICTNPKDSLEKLCQLCLIYEIDAMPLIEVMSEKIYTFSSNSLSLTEMFENVANHIFSKQSDLRKEIGEIMGGKILELESERLLRTGKEQGLIQGEEKAKLDIAKRMLERSFSLEDIQFSTGLSKKELEKL